MADDRRTASAWFVTAGVQDDWDRFYDCLIRVGQTSGKLAPAVLGLAVQKFAQGLGEAPIPEPTTLVLLGLGGLLIGLPRRCI